VSKLRRFETTEPELIGIRQEKGDALDWRHLPFEDFVEAFVDLFDRKSGQLFCPLSVVQFQPGHTRSVLLKPEFVTKRAKTMVRLSRTSPMRDAILTVPISDRPARLFPPLRSKARWFLIYWASSP
jgi:hypothetical protein